MSETVLKIIPIDQDYVPNPAQQANALARLRELVPFGMHEARVYDDLTFIDQGEYCEAVLCPSCTGRVAVDPCSGSDLARDWYYGLIEAITAGAPSPHLQDHHALLWDERIFHGAAISLSSRLCLLRAQCHGPMHRRRAYRSDFAATRRARNHARLQAHAVRGPARRPAKNSQSLRSLGPALRRGSGAKRWDKKLWLQEQTRTLDANITARMPK
jgi:hypothetical protein